MGIENREYMREEDYPNFGGGGSGKRSMVITIILINVAVLVAQVVITRSNNLETFTSRYDWRGVPQETIETLYTVSPSRISIVEEWFDLNVKWVLRGQIWRTFTYAFLHDTDNIWHIFWNMFLLYLAGRALEDSLGPREFRNFYLVACVASGVFFVLWRLITNEWNPAVGASGAVASVFMLYVMKWPHARWMLFFVIPVPVVLILIIHAASDILPMLRFLGGHGDPQDNVAHSAHVGGLLFGYLYHVNRWHVTDWFSAVPSISFKNLFRRRPKLRVHHPEAEEPVRRPVPTDVAARMDELLAKMTRNGADSLTDEERAFMAEASRLYRR